MRRKIENAPNTDDSRTVKATDDASTSSASASSPADDFISSPFYAALRRALHKRGVEPEELCDACDIVERRLLLEYGAMFLATRSVRVPPRCVFRSAEECERFQAEAEPAAAIMGDARIELQPAALEALLAARSEAQAAGFEITPRDGAEAARRSYADTLRLWESRVTPALAHWVTQESLAQEEANRLSALSSREQIAAVLAEEERGNFFSKDFSRTILSSVAAPGASQHLSMLAFDASEFRETRVREILARHGWFQTVRYDLPHFTFLGVREKELRALGLKRVEDCGQTFWIPDI
ncbi:MAG TPA: hypothetical protein VGO96_18590 [Pyrinomonadaceae bacterium]|nr:hypothetical protein [Pyrinomonadaceae bacterium]